MSSCPGGTFQGFLTLLSKTHVFNLTGTYLGPYLYGQLSKRIHFLQTSPSTFFALCSNNTVCSEGCVGLHASHPGADHSDGREDGSASCGG